MRDKKSWVKFLSAIVFILVAGVLFAWGIYFIFCNPFSLDTSGDPGTLISAYSIFIMVVLFVIGVPIALFSYNTRKESKEDFKEIKEDYDRNKNDYENIKKDYEKIKESSVQQHLEIKDQIRPIEDEIKENAAFKKVDELYKEDPQNIWKGQGLGEFSDCFSKKHSQEAKKYFYQAKYLMKDKLIDRNEIKDDFSIYKKDIQIISTAIGYFRMCEDLMLVNTDKENFCYDIYREISNAYKSLGLRFFKHNSAIALDHLLNALEYCQKAICEIDSFMLPYNNKSNILKDIFILCRNAGKETRSILRQKLNDKLLSFYLNVFDFKQIGEYIVKIYNDTNLLIDENIGDGIRVNQVIEQIKQLKDICSEPDNCAKCKWNCSEYYNKAGKFNDMDILLLLLIVESIICINKKVLDNLPAFKEDEEEQYLNIQRCYYNCAISNYMLIEYSLIELKAKPTKEKYSLSEDFQDYLIHAIEYVGEQNKHKRKYQDDIRNDVDLRSLLINPKEGKHENEFLESLREKIENIIKEKLRIV